MCQEMPDNVIFSVCRFCPIVGPCSSLSFSRYAFCPSVQSQPQTIHIVRFGEYFYECQLVGKAMLWGKHKGSYLPYAYPEETAPW